MSEEKEVIKNIEELLSKQNGEVFIGMVHSVYGPIRGLNFIINSKTPEELIKFLDSQRIEIELDNQLEIIEKLKNEEPKNLLETIIKIWSKTGLSTQAMILPMELAEQAENTPSKVNSFREGEKEILKSLELTHSLQVKDPHFFRSGII